MTTLPSIGRLVAFELVFKTVTLWAALAIVPSQLAGAPTPQAAREGRLAETPIFESSLHPDGRVSEIGQLGGAMLLGTSQLVFVDRTSQQLIFVDITNGAVASAGGRGDGPSEFRSARLLVRQPDGGVVVWDDGRQRFTRATRDGVIAEGAEYDRSLLKSFRAQPVVQYSDGALVFRDGASTSRNLLAGRLLAASRREGRFRDTVQYRVLEPDGSAHLFAEALGNEMASSVSGGRRTSGPVVFGHVLLESQVGQHLAVAQSDLGVIRVFDRLGEVVAEVPMPQGVSVSRQQIAAERERRSVGSRGSTNQSRPLGSAGLRELLRGQNLTSGEFGAAQAEHFRSAPANDVAPPIDRIMGDWDGRLWLRLLRPGEAMEYWQVWNISGPSLMFTLTLPEGERLLDSAGGRVLLQTQDEFGADYLLVKEMVNGAREGWEHQQG